MTNDASQSSKQKKENLEIVDSSVYARNLTPFKRNHGAYAASTAAARFEADPGK